RAPQCGGSVCPPVRRGDCGRTACGPVRRAHAVRHDPSSRSPEHLLDRGHRPRADRGPMSHTLALWPGSPPADAASACREYSLRMLSRGIEWSRSATVPEQDARMLAFCRAAGRLLLSEPGGRASPLRDPSEVGTLWGEVLTLEFDGPQPLAL